MESENRPQNLIAMLKAMIGKFHLELQWISDLISTTRSFPYPDFFEPKTFLFKNRTNKEARFVISADLLAAWIGHLSHGTRKRMEIFEDEVLDSLSKERLLTAATMTRCHLEASAWAVYGLEELTKAADASDWSKLEILIPKMLNGAAVMKENRHTPEASIDELWVDPSSIMNAIDALDRYYGVCTGNKAHEARILYAILSDFAHPSIFGVRHIFYGKENNEGWTITYRSNEKLNEKDYGMILKTLLISMRLGHSAALMLRLGSIEDCGDSFRYVKPSPQFGAGVWEQILNAKLGEPT
ncbi:MAG TPA: hypothetical protein PLK94_04625 [Alphaproteobacteria bacterium]|nr:hypothetical protein [Alphaproteobacteria bacterium]